ncbi:MAG: glutathione S-transferase [Myxococcota bacterium]|nr:glutathione S-transferase [Myxococcota bacterium]
MHSPILYSFRRCPYAMRARIVLRLAGVRCVLREVVLRDKPQAMLDVSPKGTVPVLILPDGRILDESLDIIEWAIGARDRTTSQLDLKPIDERGHSLIGQNDGDFKFHLDRYKYPNRYEQIDRCVQRAACEQFLRVLEHELSGNEWLAGDTPNVVDACLGPFIRQFANTDRGWFDQCDYPEVRRWLAGFLAWEGFTAVMAKYAQWQPEQAPIIFPSV